MLLFINLSKVGLYSRVFNIKDIKVGSSIPWYMVKLKKSESSTTAKKTSCESH